MWQYKPCTGYQRPLCSSDKRCHQCAKIARQLGPSLVLKAPLARSHWQQCFFRPEYAKCRSSCLERAWQLGKSSMRNRWRNVFLDVKVPGTDILVSIKTSNGPSLAVRGLTCADVWLSRQAQVCGKSWKRRLGHQEFPKPHLQAVTTLQVYDTPAIIHRMKAGSSCVPCPGWWEVSGKKIGRLGLRLAKTPYYRLHAPREKKTKWFKMTEI